MMMRALRPFQYGDRQLKAGDRFTLHNEHGDVSVHRHVLLAGQYAEDVMNGESVVPKEAKKRRGRPPGTYKRRDMRAEDE